MTPMMQRLCEAARKADPCVDTLLGVDRSAAEAIVTAVLTELRDLDGDVREAAATVISGAPFPSPRSRAKAEDAVKAAIDAILSPPNP